MSTHQSDFDLLARFVNQSTNYSKNSGHLKSGGLKLRTDELGLSVYGILNLTSDDVYSLGNSLQTPPRRVHGYGEFIPDHFVNEGLNLDTTTGSRLHADVFGWPSGEEDRLEIANSLCLKSKLVLF